VNVPPTIGMAVSSGKVSYEALDTVLGLEDLYDILEIVLIDGHNAIVLAKRKPKDR